MPASRPPGLRLEDLPEDILLLICDYTHPDALHSMSLISPFWEKFCLTAVWPRRLAVKLGVRTIRLQSDSTMPADGGQFSTQTAPELSHIPDAKGWTRLLHTVSTHPESRTLCISVELSPADSVTSLALQYAVTRQDIFRTNALFSEHHVASRTRLYIPLMSEASVLHFTGTPTNQHAPFLIRDNQLSNKYFLVVKFRSLPGHSLADALTLSRRESYVRELVVKLIAKGLSVDEDEVRFYLDDNNFDLARAYKQLLSDHNFSS